MVIASRTPEGEPAECPVCGAVVCAEPSVYFADAPCPSCGSLLWFVRLGNQNILVQPSALARRKGLINILAELTGRDEKQLEGNPELIAESEFDSIQLVELVVELEDELSD